MAWMARASVVGFSLLGTNPKAHVSVSTCNCKVQTRVRSGPTALTGKPIDTAIMASTTNEKDPWNQETKSKFEG